MRADGKDQLSAHQHEWRWGPTTTTHEQRRAPITPSSVPLGFLHPSPFIPSTFLPPSLFLPFILLPSSFPILSLYPTSIPFVPPSLFICSIIRVLSNSEDQLSHFCLMTMVWILLPQILHPSPSHHLQSHWLLSFAFCCVAFWWHFLYDKKAWHV